MRYRKGSVDYSVNLESLREMEEAVPMTLHERECLRSWAKAVMTLIPIHGIIMNQIIVK